MSLSTSFRFTALLCLLLSAGAQAAPPPTSPRVDAFVKGVMHDAGIPGMAVLVIRGGKVTMEKGYGYANLARKQPVTVDTPFNIASISKPILGFALLDLWEHDRLDLDADINRYLPFRVDNPKVKGEKITIRSLASHSSGLADYYDLNAYARNKDSDMSLGDYLRSVLIPGGARYDHGAHYMKAMPGTRHEYSNLGAGVAGYVLESITGDSLDHYSQRTLFGPLGMHHTGWLLADFPDLDAIAVPYEVKQCIPHTRICFDTGAPRRATFVARWFDRKHAWRRFAPYPHFGNPEYPDGGVRSSIDDMARLMLAIVNNSPVLDARMKHEMMRAQTPKLAPEQRFFLRDNSYGWTGHMGSDLGILSAAYFDMSSRSAVVVLMNRGEGPEAFAALKTLFKGLVMGQLPKSTGTH